MLELMFASLQLKLEKLALAQSGRGKKDEVG